MPHIDVEGFVEIEMNELKYNPVKFKSQTEISVLNIDMK